MKKFVSLLLAIIFVLSAVPLSEIDEIGKNLFSTKAEAASLSDLVFKLNEDENSYYVAGFNRNATGEVVIPSTYNGLPVTRIGNNALSYYYYSSCKITKITISYGIEEIGYGAFWDCYSVTEISLPESLKTIGASAFYGCEGISEITIPNSVEVIESGAFSHCFGLTSVTLGSGIKEMGSEIFGHGNEYSQYYCPIKKVYINDIASWCDIDFYDETSNPLYIAQNESSLYLNGQKVTSLVIPEGVKSIGNYAFINCKGITSVTFPETLKAIGEEAFYGCKGITSAVIPTSVSSIGSNCFHSNTVLSCNCQSPFAGTYNTTHNYSTEWTVDKVATAKAAGSKSHHCIDCGAKTDVTAIPRLAPGATKLSKVANGLKGVVITWKAVSGADNYIIYRKSGSSGFKAIKTVSGKSTSYTDTTAKSGTKYTYTVQAKNVSGKGGYNKTGLSILYLAVPKTIKVKNAASGVSISWSKVTGAKGYTILRMNTAGKVSKVATISKQSTVSYTDTKVSNGAYYYYSVVPYNGSTKGEEKASSIIMYLTSPTITKIKSTSNGIYLEWTKNSKAQYYYIYRKVGNGKYELYDYVSSYYLSAYDYSVRGKKYSYYVVAYKDGYQSSHKNAKSCTDRYY